MRGLAGQKGGLEPQGPPSDVAPKSEGDHAREGLLDNCQLPYCKGDVVWCRYRGGRWFAAEIVGAEAGGTFSVYYLEYDDLVTGQQPGTIVPSEYGRRAPSGQTLPPTEGLDVLERGLRERIACDPADHEAYYELGMVLSDLGKCAEAGRMLCRAIKLAPEEPEYYYGASTAFIDRSDFDSAARALDKGLAITDGADYFNRRRFWEARAVTEDDGAPALRQALSYANLGDYPRAAERIMRKLRALSS
jgi:tetratricopeptide (TPR) repeat protein